MFTSKKTKFIFFQRYYSVKVFAFLNLVNTVFHNEDEALTKDLIKEQAQVNNAIGSHRIIHEIFQQW